MWVRCMGSFPIRNQDTSQDTLSIYWIYLYYKLPFQCFPGFDDSNAGGWWFQCCSTWEESRIKVRADKGSNRRKVEPLSARTFILATFFQVHTEVLMPQRWQTYQWKAHSEWGSMNTSNIYIKMNKNKKFFLERQNFYINSCLNLNYNIRIWYIIGPSFYGFIT